MPLPQSDFDFDLLVETYHSWPADGTPFNYSTVVLEQDWDYPPTKEEFNQFVAELGEGRCLHCGSWYEPMTADEGSGTVCENCGAENQ